MLCAPSRALQVIAPPSRALNTSWDPQRGQEASGRLGNHLIARAVRVPPHHHRLALLELGGVGARLYRMFVPSETRMTSPALQRASVPRERALVLGVGVGRLSALALKSAARRVGRW